MEELEISDRELPLLTDITDICQSVSPMRLQVWAKSSGEITKLPMYLFSNYILDLMFIDL